MSIVSDFIQDNKHVRNWIIEFNDHDDGYDLGYCLEGMKRYGERLDAHLKALPMGAIKSYVIEKRGESQYSWERLDSGTEFEDLDEHNATALLELMAPDNAAYLFVAEALGHGVGLWEVFREPVWPKCLNTIT